MLGCCRVEYPHNEQEMNFSLWNQGIPLVPPDFIVYHGVSEYQALFCLPGRIVQDLRFADCEGKVYLCSIRNAILQYINDIQPVDIGFLQFIQQVKPFPGDIKAIMRFS